jgi:hypothetical protein
VGFELDGGSLPKSPRPATTMCPAAARSGPYPEKTLISQEISGPKNSAFRIRHGAGCRVCLECSRWRRPRTPQLNNDSLQRLFPPPPKTHTSIAATRARGFPNHGPFSFSVMKFAGQTPEGEPAGAQCTVQCAEGFFGSSRAVALPLPCPPGGDPIRCPPRSRPEALAGPPLGDPARWLTGTKSA